jgi:proteic killer suppression protein
MKSLLCFFILAHFSLYCSDFIDKNNVDLAMARAMGGSDSSNLTQDDLDEFYYRAQALSAEYPADLTNESMLTKYINACQYDYAILLGLPVTEKFMKTFYTHDSKHFEKYIGGHWLDKPELKKAWSQFYYLGAYYLLGEKYYQDSCSLLMSAREINAAEVKTYLPLYLTRFYNISDSIKPPVEAYFCMAQTCADIIKIPGEQKKNFVEYASLALLYHGAECFQEALDYSLLSIECPCEKSLREHKKLQDDQHRGKFGFYYYALKRYEDAKKFYYAKSHLNERDLIFLSCIYSIEGDHTTSFKYFKKVFDMPSAEFKVTVPMITLIFDTLLQQNSHNFRKYGLEFLKAINAEYNTSDIRQYLKDLQKEEASSYFRNAIAKQKLKLAQDSLRSFDKEYQYLWSKLSSIEENLEEFFAPLNKISQEIENNFDRLRKIQQQEHIVRDFCEIMELSDSLQKLFAQFFMASQKIKIEIANTRRLKNRSLVPALTPTTIQNDDSKSIKAQILEEQASVDAEKKIRAQIAAEKKVQRNQVREGLKVIKALSAKTEDLAETTIVHNALISFKDSSLEQCFRSGELPTNLMEILTALSSSTSIYDLRTRLKSGTKPENLKGDRKGQMALRTNDQYRLCFTWISGEGAHNIEYVDYH